jgi:arylformamidase
MKAIGTTGIPCVQVLLVLLLCVSELQAGPLRDRLRNDSGGAIDVPAGVTVLRDVAYGADKAQRMDVYLPANPQNAPVIFMVHGGAWRNGDKENEQVVNHKLARWVPRGLVFISVNYRMLPKADPLIQADDVAHALAAAQQKAVSWGADPSKFILMGHSAGAHLVSLLNAAPQRAYAQGAQPWLGAVSLDTATVDLVQVMERRHYRFYDQAFGKDPAFWRAASPMWVLTKEAKPLLLVCSSERRDKPCEETGKFVAKAKDMGVRAAMLPQPKSHREINEDLGLPGSYTDAVEAFMASLLSDTD